MGEGLDGVRRSESQRLADFGAADSLVKVADFGASIIQQEEAAAKAAMARTLVAGGMFEREDDPKLRQMSMKEAARAVAQANLSVSEFAEDAVVAHAIGAASQIAAGKTDTAMVGIEGDPFTAMAGIAAASNKQMVDALLVRTIKAVQLRADVVFTKDEDIAKLSTEQLGAEIAAIVEMDEIRLDGLDREVILAIDLAGAV